MDSLTVQYLAVGLLVMFAVFTVFKKAKAQFSAKKNKNGCDTNCGCS